MLKKGYLKVSAVALVVLAIALVFCMTLTPVAYAEARQVEGSSYLVEDYEEGVMIVGSSSSVNPTCILPTELDGKPVVAIGAGLYDTNAANGKKYTLIVPSSVRYIEADAFVRHPELVIYIAGNTTGFDPDWNSNNNAYVENVTIGSYTYTGDHLWETKTGYFVESFMDTDVHNKENDTFNVFSMPGKEKQDKNTFAGFDYNQNAETASYARLRVLPEASNQRLYSIYKHSEGGGSQSCVAEGTLVTLANGQQVPVETLTGSEELLVWDMVNGTYASAPILFVDSEDEATYEIIELTFADGTIVKVISEHAFFDVDAQEYVFLRADAANYIGHTFNKGDVNVELVAVNVYEEVTTAWSPVTAGALCLYVNGMLSMPGNTEGFINIFAVEDMKVNAELMAQDIATYGLYTYEEFCAEVVEIPQEAFEAFNGQYLKVSMGKGLITVDEVKALYNRYESFFAQEEVEVSLAEQIANAIKSAFDAICKFFGLKK